MKHKIITIISALLFLHLGGYSEENPVDSFTKLRMNFAQSNIYSPVWKSDDQREKITDAWDLEKIDEGRKLAKQWLEKYPIDAEMHGWYSFFLMKQGDYQNYFYHKVMKDGLLASITSSGTGISEASPWKVISVSEEYSVLNYLNAELVSQSLITNSDGIACDRMECTIEGAPITFYFDVSISMAAMEKMFNPEKIEASIQKNEPTSKDVVDPVDTQSETALF